MFLVCFPLTRHLLTANRTSTPSVFMKTQQTANIRHKHDNTVFYIHTRSFPRKVWFRFGNAFRSKIMFPADHGKVAVSGLSDDCWTLTFMSCSLMTEWVPKLESDASGDAWSDHHPRAEWRPKLHQLGPEQQSIVLDNTVPMFFYLRLDGANWAPRTAQIFSICLLTDVKPLYDAIMTYSSIRFCFKYAMFSLPKGQLLHACFHVCRGSQILPMQI